MSAVTAWVKPKLGQKNLTLGHLRQAIAGLPDDTPVAPAWTEVPSDDEPAVSLEEFGIQTFDNGRQFVFGVRLQPLDDPEFWGDGEDKDATK